jgi:quercetin 2,3-dioxygenase
MITIRRSHERGAANHGWLDTRFSFSFANYFDPEHMGFRALRVINDDRIAPLGGFDTHGHQDMEIVTYVLEGALKHKDSMGNGSVIRAGEVQRITAGTGILHSEFNPSDDKAGRLLQIWILPERDGLKPGYEERAFPAEEKRGTLRLIASRTGEAGSITVHQDVSLYASILPPGQSLSHRPARDRYTWIQVARGSMTLNGNDFLEGDGAAIEDEAELTFTGVEECEFLLFDLG